MFGPECSTDEAVRDTMNDVPPVCERHIVKHHYFGESDYPYVFHLEVSRIFFTSQRKNGPPQQSGIFCTAGSLLLFKI